MATKSERIADIEKTIISLDEKRKELIFESAKEKILANEDGELHENCAPQNEFDDLEEELKAAERDADDLRDALVRFGGHAPACCQGALAGTQKLHRLCTCGWNEVATRLERT